MGLTNNDPDSPLVCMKAWMAGPLARGDGATKAEGLLGCLALLGALFTSASRHHALHAQR
jgi:hypothetical protein